MARNPLQPFTGVVRFLWSATTAGFLLGVAVKVSTAFGGDLCFSSAVVAGSFSARYQGEGTLRDDVGNFPSEVRYCMADPGPGDRLLGVLDGVPTWFAYAVLFYLLLRLLERAASQGVHTAATADRLRRLGLFTLLAVPVVTLVEAFVRTLLLQHAVTFEVSLVEFVFDWSVPWWAVVSGLGMLSLAKIVRTSAEMREDLEGTV